MSMCDMANKLKTLDMAISDGFLVHFIITHNATWSMAELISYCVEEEERQKAERMKDAVNMVASALGVLASATLPSIRLSLAAVGSIRRSLRVIRARLCSIRRLLRRGCACSASHPTMSRKIAMVLRTG